MGLAALPDLAAAAQHEGMEPNGPGIVAGYDGSDFAMQALDWAMDEAEFRGVPITVCHAWSSPYGEGEEEARASLRHAAEHVLWHGAECVRQCTSGVGVREDLYEGPAGERLVELSAGADLVVVGTRAPAGLARRVLGSVAGHVVAHAVCPVIVVRGAGALPHRASPGPVVVGVGGGDPHVIEFAFREAAVRALPLVAVQAWSLPTAVWGAGMAPLVMSEAPGAEATGALEAAVEPCRRRFPQVEVRLDLVEGPARDVLVRAAAGATLLVVGATRSPGLLGRLGSVTRPVLGSALCPVAVVHP
ncbi:universal stress protein [Microbispora corallina]|uniref:Universal stress protein n=2 Tax=Microbispora corallina TaxID=83302 RepID=A0ABQ4G3L8_9ACTN|nr:universal stress protein [Microbispora corallina]